MTYQNLDPTTDAVNATSDTANINVQGAVGTYAAANTAGNTQACLAHDLNKVLRPAFVWTDNGTTATHNNFAEGVLAGLLAIKYAANDPDYTDTPAHANGGGNAAGQISKQRIDQAILKLIALKFNNAHANSIVTNYNELAKAAAGGAIAYGGGGFVNRTAGTTRITGATGYIPTRLLLNEVVNGKKNLTTAFTNVNGTAHVAPTIDTGVLPATTVT